MRNLGLGLLIIGIILILYAGFNYLTTEKVVEIDLLPISKEKNHPVQWSAIIGVFAIVGGLVTMLNSRTKNISSN
jgi:uncharacterized membrane protein YidH (DUF202 family)